MKITMSNVFINISEYDRHSGTKVVRFYDMLCIYIYTCGSCLDLQSEVLC